MSDTVSAFATFKRSGLQSAVIIGTGTAGLPTTTLVYEKKDERRTTKRWRGLDKALRKISKAREVSATDFAERYERSSQKKKNGGLRDLVKNVAKSQRKGRKKLKFRIL